MAYCIFFGEVKQQKAKKKKSALAVSQHFPYLMPFQGFV